MSVGAGTAGGLCGPVRRSLLLAGAAAWVPGVSGRAAAAAGPEQDADLPGRSGADRGAQHPGVQRLQFFLSESTWDPERVNARRLELLRADEATAPHSGGVLVIGNSGDRKDGTATAHVGRQGWAGKARPTTPWSR